MSEFTVDQETWMACIEGVRDAMAGMRVEVLAEMAKETGCTDLTPFAILAQAVLDKLNIKIAAE